jgi:hypothetical protein
MEYENGEIYENRNTKEGYTSPVNTNINDKSNQIPGSRDCSVIIVGFSFLRMDTLISGRATQDPESANL